MFNLTFGFYYGRQSDWTLYFSNEFSYFFNRIKVYCLYLKKKSALRPKVTTYNHWYICQLVFLNFIIDLSTLKMFMLYWQCILFFSIVLWEQNIIIFLTLWMSFIIRYFAGSFIIRNEESYSIDESSNIQVKVADNKNNTRTPIN